MIGKKVTVGEMECVLKLIDAMILRCQCDRYNFRFDFGVCAVELAFPHKNREKAENVSKKKPKMWPQT